MCRFQCTSRSREAIMKHASIVASVMLSALALLGSLNVSLAQSDCKTLVKASPFGPDDQVGATNRITPAVNKAAAAEIQTGVVIPMAFNRSEEHTSALQSP